MKPIRQLDNKLPLYMCIALLAVAAASVAYWLLAQLDQLGALAGSAALPGSHDSADYASVRLFVWVALSADLGAAGLLALWLRAELSRPAEPLASPSAAALEFCAGQPDDADAARQAALARRVQDMTEALGALMLKVRSSPGHSPSPGSTPTAAAGAGRAGPERRRAAPAIHLISNNPNPVPSQRSERRAPTQMVAVQSSAKRPVTPVHAWAAARQEISWEES